MGKKLFFFLVKQILGIVSVAYSQNLLFLQTLDIVAENPDKFRIVALAAGSNVTLLVDQVINPSDNIS